MYEVDERDVVIPLDEMPQSSVGSPRPFLLADDGCLILAYYIEDRWDLGRGMPPIAGRIDLGEPIAIVRFDRRTHIFGPPNDEALSGHPLASRGLRPYGAFRIEASSWIRKLERMNSVHSNHRPETYSKLQHLVFTFHDSTLESVCEGFEVRTSRGSIKEAIPEMLELFDQI